MQFNEEVPKFVEEKRSLIKNLTSSEQITIIQKVAWLLNRYPHTRDDDIELAVKYWEHYEEYISNNIISVDQLKKFRKIASISRARAKIQNSFGLFKASPAVQKKRGTLSEEYVEINNQNIPTDLVTIYADESGKTGDYILVGSIWFLESFSTLLNIEKLMLGLKIESGISEFHFNRITKRNLHIYIKLANQLKEYLSFISFKALYIENKGFKDSSNLLQELYYWLIRKGIEHENKSLRKSLPFRLSFYKDAENEGQDSLVVANIKERLEYTNSQQFNNQLFCETFLPLNSEDNFIMQLADLFTGAINRKLNPGDSVNQKDEFSECFLGAIGFSGDFVQNLTENDNVIYIKL